jgi:ABC-2 type transport system permease protein
MNLRHIFTLLGKELLHGPKSFIVVWAIVAPIVLSLVFSLIFGSWLSDTPEMGIVDEGNSQLVTMFAELDSVITVEYDSESALRQAVENGSVDMGIWLPEGFDDAVTEGEEVGLTAYVWGESLAKSRTVLGATLSNLLRELTGQEAPLEIESITLGDEEAVPWSERILPLFVLMAVFLGGIFLPATSVINEKEKKTLQALVVTPVSVGEVFVAKGFLGIMLSMIAAIIILLLNRAFGGQVGLLLAVLVLGAIMAAEIGLLSGALIKDITALMAIWKVSGILLFGPGIIYMFPNIPQWIARIFPTYYLIQPVMDITQLGGGWSDIALNTLILVGIDVVLIGLVMFVLKRTRQLAA